MLYYIKKLRSDIMSIILENIDNDLLCEAEKVLECMGLDVSTAIKMLFKKIVNEKDISFLLTKVSMQTKTQVSSTEKSTLKMTKNKAIYLFNSKGYKLGRNITFASKNKTAYNYWANPDVSILSSDWYLILNDWNKQELHLFYIPKNSISEFEVMPRSDKKNQIDLQIMYDDSSFTDTRSKLSFRKYLKETINY